MEHALPRRTVGIPRTWALCMTSENHGTVGKAGDPFSHAPGKHERVQVVEIVAAGTPPAPDVDLAGLVRIDVADLIDKLDEVRTWACNLPIPTRGAGSAMRKVREVKEALAAAPVEAQAGQVAVPDDMTAAADFIDKRAEQYLQDHADTEWDTGSIVFHKGEAGREYHSVLVELADDLRQASKPTACAVPPAGWNCTRAGGHEGPCAAAPSPAKESK